jgi:hypothetical protein
MKNGTAPQFPGVWTFLGTSIGIVQHQILRELRLDPLGDWRFEEPPGGSSVPAIFDYIRMLTILSIGVCNYAGLAYSVATLSM